VDVDVASTNRGELDDMQRLAKHAGMRLLAAADFQPATSPIRLSADEIHVWFCPDEGGDDESGDDAVQRLLGAYLGVEAATVVLERDPHGKPFLAAPVDSDMQFNLSHSGNTLVVAVGRGQAVGVDIESGSRARPWLALAERYFTPAEHAALAALPAPRLASAFLELWSCKEAVVKALGRGIAFGLHRLGFAWTPDGALAGLIEIAAEAGGVDEWHVVRLAPAPGLVGALAWRGPRRRLRALRVVSGSREP
jgi:4'-phosphopantetheinyl transferase